MKKGFTLIELLVVIAIIAILAAILFPVFAAAREKAKSITCTSNQKQIGLALMQYVQDYDETWPAWDRGVNNVTDKFWQFQVQPYLKSTGVWMCPDNKETIKADAIGDLADGTKMIADYAGNINGDPNGPYASSDTSNGQGMFGAIQSPGVKDSEVLSPSSTIATVEVDGLGSTWSWLPLNCCQNWSGASFNVPHQGRSNYLFADGHVKSLAPYDTVRGCNLSGSNIACTSGNNMWTRDNTLAVDQPILAELAYGNNQGTNL
jgi:prepilin-type N-terminal cleavage/methylation domain-containing protein/prepilin-type processing-associated H-X9-DG protein